ncbi:hypothetical protein F5Y08DRAFT_299480 [Xylaria arbuscula]|nr:hypothetical protein F5Y08DRAFT_299480 [Xylaria arbuscula]
MDALAVSAAVIQFIDFTCGLIAKGVSIHSSMTGLAIDHQELKTITASVLRSSNEIQKSISRSGSDAHESQEAQLARQRLNKNETDLQNIAVGCRTVAEELLTVLAELTSKGPKSRWRSFRHALKATWNEGKVQSLENRLDRYKQQMMTNVLSSLRHQTEMLIREQSSMQQSVRKIEELQRKTKMIGDQFMEKIIGGEEWKRDLVKMIHEHGRVELHEMSDLSQLKDNKGRTPNAVIAQERQAQQRILHKLAFRDMNDRERRICKAHEQTFEWIFCDPKTDSRPWSSFKDFLVSPHKKIYWITGKPGSGKSTLMKHIRHHPQTTTLLEHWSGRGHIIQAAFYFWNSGSLMQMSVDGLLQAILHECLRQLPARAVQDVLPERWEVATLFNVDDYPWSWEEVASALRKLIIEFFPEKKFFFIIDGLDECSGDQAQLIELIRELAENTENLKLCLASRPWNNFEDAFRNRPSLRVQDLSAPDIERFITSAFSANDGFAELQARDFLGAKKLLEAISEKAEGVFLWVHLVVRSLLEGLTNGDGLQELRTRLEELPPNLEALYANILENLDERYLSHASRLFQIVRACKDSPTLLLIGLADLEEDDRAIQASVHQIPMMERFAICKNMRRKLASRCRGLLDIHPRFPRRLDGDNSPLNVKSFSESTSLDGDGGGVGYSMANMKVQYLHRSVLDYIERPEVWSWLVSIHKEPFDPHLPLLRATVLEAKSRLGPSKKITNAAPALLLYLSIQYAKESLAMCSTKKQVREVVLLLDEVDNFGKIITGSFIKHDTPEKHWSNRVVPHRAPIPSFLYLMAVCGVHQYLEMRLQVEHPEHDTHNDGCSTPPIIWLFEYTRLGDDATDKVSFRKFYGLHYDVFETLLQKGYDCHKPWHGRSAWDLAMKGGYTNILKLFEKYRGKPPQPSPGDNGKEFQRHRKRRGRQELDNESNASTEALTGHESEIDRNRYFRTRSLPMSRGKGTRKANEQLQSDSSEHHLQPPRSPEDRRHNVVRSAPPPRSSRISLRPRSMQTQIHNPFLPVSHNPYPRYDEDDDSMNGYQGLHLSHNYRHTYNPPPHIPASYWRRTQPRTPNPFRPMPLHPPHFPVYYQEPPYVTQHPPSPMYRGEYRPPFTIRGQYDGGYGRDYRY